MANFVVKGALAKCSGCTDPNKLVKFLAIDKRFSIGGYPVGLKSESAPENFSENFGKCSFLGGQDCVLDFVESGWFGVDERVRYDNTGLVIDAMTAQAADAVENYIRIVEDAVFRGMFEQDWAAAGAIQTNWKELYKRIRDFKKLVDARYDPETFSDRGIEDEILSDLGKDVLKKPVFEKNLDNTWSINFLRSLEKMYFLIEIYHFVLPDLSSDYYQNARTELEAIFDYLGTYKEKPSSSEGEGLLLDTSLLVCKRGGYVSFVTNGQENPEGLYQASQFDEKVHLVIRNRISSDMLSEGQYNDSESTLYKNVFDPAQRKVWSEDERTYIYASCPYDYSGTICEAFLPFVFTEEQLSYFLDQDLRSTVVGPASPPALENDDTDDDHPDGNEGLEEPTCLSTIRKFDEAYQEELHNNAERIHSAMDGEGTRIQDDMGKKLYLLGKHVRIAERLAFMIRDGVDAVQNYETQAGALLGTSNYGLWGKWYDERNGWHRGIDVCPGGNVHVIWPGELVEIGNSGGIPYYLSLFSEDLGVTITYMHLAIGTHADGAAFQVGDHFEMGAVLGTQSNRITKDSHTHIEINQGIYRPGETAWETGFGVARPMSADNEAIKLISIDEIEEGVKMSINPYPYLDRIWQSRSQMQWRLRVVRENTQEISEGEPENE